MAKQVLKTRELSIFEICRNLVKWYWDGKLLNFTVLECFESISP